MTPTVRSLSHLRSLGYTVSVTERWNPFAHIRQDLYGFIDILAIKPGEILAVQTTTDSNVSARLHKIAEEPRAGAWLVSGGKIVVHGWKKTTPPGRRRAVWTLREVCVDSHPTVHRV
jgi:carbonic anhydrase